MAVRMSFENSEQALQEYLDSCYATSHSTVTVNSYKNAMTEKTKGFKIFLKKIYDCDKNEE